ncbi:MAG TPA: hypothetical protein VK585_16745 [Jiangellaceae bacterium]|nr:hypothetical protein [Jiangellaceae bacterium]
MDSLHRLTIEADNGEDVLFVCSIESCGRRLVVKRSGGLVVLERGDFFARHAGGSNGLDITVGLGSRA